MESAHAVGAGSIPAIGVTNRMREGTWEFEPPHSPTLKQRMMLHWSRDYFEPRARSIAPHDARSV